MKPRAPRKRAAPAGHTPRVHGGRSVDPKQQARTQTALAELEKLRKPLLLELDVISSRPQYLRGRPAHECCTRKLNQMRISPLEAQAIAVAFQRDPDLREKLPEVLRRLHRELEDLADNDSRQNFDCPLLDGTRCLVHRVAKPIGCLAWHPSRPGQRESAHAYTSKGWKAFSQRDALNDRVYGPEWKLRVIPLWLKRVFGIKLDSRSAGQRRGGKPYWKPTKHGRERR